LGIIVAGVCETPPRCGDYALIRFPRNVVEVPWRGESVHPWISAWPSCRPTASRVHAPCRAAASTWRWQAPVPAGARICLPAPGLGRG